MKINVNKNFGLHNTSKRTGGIKYLAIHYVGATGTAKNNIDYFNKPTTTSASADFFVGHNGEIWQYNPNPKSRYCWAIGGGKQSNYGGSLYKIATNQNTISIEMCVKKDKNQQFYLTDETFNATVKLSKYLMKLYNIPMSHVIRHFDVNGKYCPGLKGWIPPLGSETTWLKFKSLLTNDVQQDTSPQKTFLVRVKINNLNIRSGAGTHTKVVGVITQGTFTIVDVKSGQGSKNGWGKLKSGAGWISLDHVERV